MKTIVTIILFFALSLVYGQDNLRFRVTTLKEGNEFFETSRSVTQSAKLDIDFYKKNFLLPCRFPDKMVDLKYINDTVTVWNEPKKGGDCHSNWSYTTVYDSQSRVLSYSYSGCMLCSQSPFEFRFFYDQSGHVVKATNDLYSNTMIDFNYNTDGNIVDVLIFRDSNLTQRIELIK
jgi:hypothetical protein